MLLENKMFKKFMRRMRRSAFEFTLQDGRTLGEVVLAPLVQNGIEPLVVDIGARNGMQLVPSGYSRQSRIIGFEPNPEEYKKLVAKDTDAHKVGAPIVDFKAEEYHPCAIWDSNGSHEFFITLGPGACTLMGHTLPQITSKMFIDHLDERRYNSFEKMVTTVKETVSVPCRTLDDIIGTERVCDFLKIDVEGAELRCLKGAKRLFSEKRVLFVYTEFVAFHYYQEHCVLGDQHTFLNDHGMRLLDIDMGHASYRRSAEDLPESADRRLLHAGDAFFCLDPDTNALTPYERQRIAAMCFIFGFNSFALTLLREAGLNSTQDIEAIRRAILNTYTIKRLKHIWAHLPRTIIRPIRGY